MICITGDIHGDIGRFEHRSIKKLKKGDTLIVCGDFGFMWDGSKKEKKLLKKLGKSRYNILFVDGCHENYDLLNEYETTEFCGGKVRRISGKVMHLMRGEVYEIDNKKIFAFGGGLSEDNELRIKGETWWKDECPNEDEMKNGLKNLARHDYKVDYIVTHEPPAVVWEFIDMDRKSRSIVGTYLNTIKDKCEFDKWYFGKCHINKVIPSKFYALFDNVEVPDDKHYKRTKTGEIKPPKTRRT